MNKRNKYYYCCYKANHILCYAPDSPKNITLHLIYNSKIPGYSEILIRV